jgi:hypothetical protein
MKELIKTGDNLIYFFGILSLRTCQTIVALIGIFSVLWIIIALILIPSTLMWWGLVGF